MDQVTTTTAPFPSTPVRQFSFTDFSVNNPTTPQPGDRIDSEYDRTNASTAQIITWASVSLNTDGTIRAGAIGQDQLVSGLFDDIAQGIIDDVQPLVDEATGAANSALASSHTAQAAATAADTSNVQAQGAAAAAQTAATSAATSVTTAQTYAFNAQTAATDAGNAGNHADGAAALAQDYADVTEAWAEHMPDTIPPNILAVMGITGDHWSSRWWATRAEAAFGGITTTLYLGAWPTPPTATATGDPLTQGALYYNTVLQQPFVWNGSAWVPFYAPTKALLLTLLYRASANQTVFPLTTPDLGGQNYSISPVTPEPLECFVNGIRSPQDDPNPGNGDWTLNNTTSTITFLRPLLAGTMVQFDIMTPAAQLAPTRVQTQALADINLDPATGNPGQIDGTRTTFPLIFTDGAHTPVNPGSAQELFISLDGVVQQPNISFTVSAGNIVFTEAPAVAAVFWGYWYGPGLSGTGPGAGFLPITGGTLTGPLTLTGPPTLPLMAATKSYADGVLTYTATGGNTARSAQDRAVDTVSATDFGVKADGVTDDTIALNAAITAAASKILMLPKGRMIINSAVTISNTLTMRGYGAATIIQRGATLNAVLITASAPDCILQDFAIDGNGVANTANTFAHVLLSGTRCVAQRLRITNHRRAAISLSADYCRAEDCNITGMADPTIPSYGVWALNNNVGIQVINNTILDNGIPGIITSGAGHRIIGNYLKGNHRQTSPTGGGQIAVGASDGLTQGAIIANNVIDTGGGTATSGIEPNCGNSVIAGNTIQFQGTHGIAFDATSSGCVVVGNTVRNNGNSGVFIAAGVNNIQVVGNRIIDDQGTPTQLYGVRCPSGSVNNLIVNSNVFAGNKTAPVSVTFGTGCVQIGNSGVADVTAGLGNSLTLGDGTAGTTFTNNGAAATSRAMLFRTAGVNRWQMMADNSAESGSNNGSNFSIIGYTDAGAANSNNSIQITRSNGIVRMPLGAVILGGSTTIDAAVIGGTTPNTGTFTQVKTGGTAGPTWTAGTGVPAATQPVGSLFSRTDGASGTTLYVSRGGGTWNAVAGV